ncbi:transcriptional repressor [Variovorax sp. CT11-76]
MERLTRQRAAVFSAFSDASRVLTAPEIHAHARELVPEISLSTVYRQVSALLADGEIAKVELPGEPARYEGACRE